MFEKRSSPPEKVREFLLGEDADVRSSAGTSVTPDSAMAASAVYACVRIISETVASLPLCVYERTGERGKLKARSHPLYTLLHDAPNTEMTSFAFRETLMAALLLHGNAYAQILRSNGQITGLFPLLPERMTVTRDMRSNALIYTYSSDKGTYALSSRDILHVPGLSFDGVLGVSPVALAKEAVGLALATEEFGARFFSNGARPGGVLEHPGLIRDPEKIRKSWDAVYKGTHNSHRIAVLEEGLKYHEIGVAPEAAQFLETRKFQVSEICRIFRVPPHMVGDLERATFSNIEHQSIEFVEHTIRPWLVRLEQAMLRALLEPEERERYFIQFNVDGLLRGDFATRMAGYAVGRQNGWLSANDIRELEDMDPLPDGQGGDEYLVNGNMCTAATGKRSDTPQGEAYMQPDADKDQDDSSD